MYEVDRAFPQLETALVAAADQVGRAEGIAQLAHPTTRRLARCQHLWDARLRHDVLQERHEAAHRAGRDRRAGRHSACGVARSFGAAARSLLCAAAAADRLDRPGACVGLLGERELSRIEQRLSWRCGVTVAVAGEVECEHCVSRLSAE